MHTGLLFGFSLAGLGQGDRNCLASGLAGGHLGPDVGRDGLLRGSGLKGHRLDPVYDHAAKIIACTCAGKSLILSPGVNVER